MSGRKNKLKRKGHVKYSEMGEDIKQENMGLTKIRSTEIESDNRSALEFDTFRDKQNLSFHTLREEIDIRIDMTTSVVPQLFIKNSTSIFKLQRKENDRLLQNQVFKNKEEVTSKRT
ncbi:hypothetical protein Tco_0137678 [Tanacetum coccineum]